MPKRAATNSNCYPEYQSYRQLHSCLRDAQGRIVRPVPAADKKTAVRYELLGVKDVLYITPDKTGRRRLGIRELAKIEPVLDADWKGDLYKYCTHCETQHLLPITEYTSNSAGYRGCLLTREDAQKYHLKGHSTQPYCKECKRTYVNASGNPKRTAEQFVEASAIARVRNLLPAPLKDSKVSLEAVFSKYGDACFKCTTPLDVAARSTYEIDHTLPASLFWPLSGDNCTLLCSSCNQEKSDLWPSYYYSKSQIRELATLTDILENILEGERHINPEAIAFFGDKSSFSKRITECYEGAFSRRKDKGKIRQRYDASFKNLIDKVKKICHNDDKETILTILADNKNTKHLLVNKKGTN